MALIVPFEVGGLHINDAPFVHVSIRNMARGNEVSEPFCGIRVDLIVIGGQTLALNA